MILFKRLTFYLALAGLVSMVLLVRRMAQTTPEPDPPSPPPKSPYRATVAGAGLVEARGENILIGAPVQGLATAVHAAVWDRVEKGAPLFELDNRELKASLLKLEADAAVARASLHRVEGQLARLDALKARNAGAVTLEEYRTRTSDVEVARAQARAAEAAANQTRTLIERLVVRAPRDGTILRVNVRPGEYVSSGGAEPPMILGNIDTQQVRVDIDEELAPRFVPGSPATGFLKGDTTRALALTFVRVEPFIVPKRSLTGVATERVDTRVLQAIYELVPPASPPMYTGQQIDVFIREPDGKDNTSP